MRILLFSGKGGVGKTTTAAATALAAADSGLSVLVLSTDPAHSLGDAFEARIGGAPELIAADLWAVQVDAQERLEESWGEIQRHLVTLLDWSGVGGLAAEELSVLPGMDELFALADIKDYADTGNFDLVVVDCAPTAETIRLLSLPDILSWAMERLFPVGRRIARAARPVWNRVPSLPPIADDDVFEAVGDMYARLEGVRTLLSDPDVTSMRLVLTPERMVIAEAQRLYTYLALFGYRVDATVTNRLLPDEVTDPYFAAWKTTQAAHLDEIEAAFSPLPALRSRLFDAEVVGIDRLRLFAAELYRDVDPLAVLDRRLEPLQVSLEGGDYVVSIWLPFASRDEIDVMRRDDQLFVTVGPHKRTMLLPQGLLRRDVTNASLQGDRLVVRFGAADAASA